MATRHFWSIGVLLLALLGLPQAVVSADDDVATLKAQIDSLSDANFRLAQEKASLKAEIAALRDRLAKAGVISSAPKPETKAAEAANPTTRPIRSLADVESNYRDRANAASQTFDAAKRAYKAEMAKADEEALSGLKALQSKAMKAEDLDAANAIQAKMDEIKRHAAEINEDADLSYAKTVDNTNFGFFGVPGTGKKVVYLCDKSGSMLSVFGALKQQLAQSMGQLHDDQLFNVVFFSDEGPDALFKDGVHFATAENVKRAIDFVNNEVASGGTLPVPAVKFAMRERPDLLYVLTDGFDQVASFDEVTKSFKTGNFGGGTKINCIFLQSDEDPKLEQLLRQIATDGHGTFKKILKSQM